MDNIKKLNILGISAYYHDSAAAIITNGDIKAAAQEERFTRKKGDPSFPTHSVKYCLDYMGATLTDIDYVVFYDKPFLKFDRLLNTYLTCAPNGISSFLKSMPIWLKKKLNLRKELTNQLARFSSSSKSTIPPLLFNLHHQSHAAAAFFPSPFAEAAVLCIDGVGEWATTTVWHGKNNKLIPKWEIHFPHSLGLLYSAFTYYVGFKVNFGEYKLMGLAPYGKPIYKDLILTKLIDLKQDGTFHLNMRYFDYLSGECMINTKFEKLFGQKARLPESEITTFHMDIASSIQAVIEEIVLIMCQSIFDDMNCDSICLGGGLALNCVMNSKLLKTGPFKNIWIQPAAGDAGSAIGAALSVWYQYLDNPRDTPVSQSAYLGPEFDNIQIKEQLKSVNAAFSTLDTQELLTLTAHHLKQGKVVGWFQGRMEFGPRALGNRSILGDPRVADMQTIMNLKIKFRESFRPFAPTVLEEKCTEYFDIDKSPYMLLVAQVNENKRVFENNDEIGLTGLDLLKRQRSCIPAVTHVDYSARVQTVNCEQNKLFYDLISKFDAITGCPVLINTSFNVRGEPIVCTPKDAYRCFMRTNIDILVIGNQLLCKDQQPIKNFRLTSNIMPLD